jgi:hypothetical protein
MLSWCAGSTLWNAGEAEAFIEHVVAPDVVFYDIPEAPDAGVFRGAEAPARLRAIMQGLSHCSLRFARSRNAATTHWRRWWCTTHGRPAAWLDPFRSFTYLRGREGRMCECRAYLEGNHARQEYERLSAKSD